MEQHSTERENLSTVAETFHRRGTHSNIWNDVKTMWDNLIIDVCNNLVTRDLDLLHLRIESPDLLVGPNQYTSVGFQQTVMIQNQCGHVWVGLAFLDREELHIPSQFTITIDINTGPS